MANSESNLINPQSMVLNSNYIYNNLSLKGEDSFRVMVASNQHGPELDLIFTRRCPARVRVEHSQVSNRVYPRTGTVQVHARRLGDHSIFTYPFPSQRFRRRVECPLITGAKGLRVSMYVPNHESLIFP